MLTYSEAFAASAIQQTAAALAHIHSKGIVHLDIKPDNLLLSSACSTADAVGVGWFPEVKLAGACVGVRCSAPALFPLDVRAVLCCAPDFGMAARVPVRRTVGTLFYVAPEILTEGWADQAADMWRFVGAPAARCCTVCFCMVRERAMPMHARGLRNGMLVRVQCGAIGAIL